MLNKILADAGRYERFILIAYDHLSYLEPVFGEPGRVGAFAEMHDLYVE